MKHTVEIAPEKNGKLHHSDDKVLYCIGSTLEFKLV